MTEYSKIIKKMSKRVDDSEVLCKSFLGSGANVGSKRKPVNKGDTVGTAKTAIYYLLLDLSTDMKMTIDKEKLRNEIYGNYDN